MRDLGGTGHEVQLRYLGASGPAVLPCIGDVYLVSSLLYMSSDPAAVRPAVVLNVPTAIRAGTRIQLVTRTSKASTGVRHPADLSIHLNRDGVFDRLVSCPATSWRPEHVRRLGPLSEPYWARVQERFQ